MVTLRSVISKYHLYMYITQVGGSVLNSYEKKRRQEGSYTGGRKEGRKGGRRDLLSSTSTSSSYLRPHLTALKYLLHTVYCTKCTMTYQG
jgi:hypothetical protein